MAYRLILTAEDAETIAFVGGRYEWSRALCLYGEGTHDLSEAETWTLAAAFEADCEGGHSPFPMLDGRSELAGKLLAFWQGIV